MSEGIPSNAKPLRADPRARLVTSYDELTRRAASPVRLLVAAVLWLIVTEFASALGIFLLSFVIGFHDAFVRGGRRWVLSPLLLVLASGASVQLTMLLAAYRRASILGRGSVAAGWGNFPLRRRAIIWTMAVIHPLFVIAWIPVISHWFVNAPRAMGVVLAPVNQAPDLPSALGLIFLVVGLAPISEDLFFRGWLWTGLRGQWPPWAAAAITGLFWLLIHYPEGGLPRVVTLLPVAMILSAAREIGGSVRASILLHIVNNATVLALLSIDSARLH